MHKLIPVAGLGLKLLEEGSGTTPTPSESITTALTTGLQTASNDAMGAIASILPYALAIVGAVIVVTLGIKIFKRVTGR